MGVPPGSDLDVYSLNRISQQYQTWNIKGTDIEAVIIIKDQKGFIKLTAKSCKSLPLALGHVQADKKNSHTPSCVFVCPMSHFTIQKSENNVHVMMIRSDCYFVFHKYLCLVFIAYDFTENVLHTLPLNCPSPTLLLAYVLWQAL